MAAAQARRLAMTGTPFAIRTQPPYITGIRDFACLAVCPDRAHSQTTQNPDGGPRKWFARATNAIVRFKEMTMATGTVKFFNGQKGFGFIAQDGGGPDVFVHVSAVERAGMRGLAEGQKLTFDVEADRKNGKSAATNLQAA
jgi:CspA family cold shock protein